MRKPVSVRRQKRVNNQTECLEQIVGNDVEKNVEMKPEKGAVGRKTLGSQKDELLHLFQVDRKELLEKIESVLCEQQRTNLSLAETEKNQLELRAQILSLQKEIGVLKQEQSSIVETIKALLSKVSDVPLLSDILAEIRILKNISREDYKTILNILLRKKQDVDTERTLSFQLGKTLIDGSKNVNNIMGLPKKLFDLRKESLRRKDRSTVIEANVIEHKPLKKISNIKKISLDQILNNKNQFDGNLLNNLILKNHELVTFSRNQDGLTITSKALIEKPRYFYSSSIIDLEQLADSIENNKLAIVFDTFAEGLNFEIIVNYLDDKKEKISFSVIKPITKVFLNVPDNCHYISLGAKVSDNGSFTIKKIQVKSLKENGNALQSKNKLLPGISIVIPSYNGNLTIGSTLKSIKDQKNIDLKAIEVICVVNGPLKKTEQVIKDFIKSNPDVNLKMMYSEIASASHARNIGIENATREFLVFLDDDDIISENYLSDMYALADQNTVVFSYIHDMDSEGKIVKETSITKQLLQNKDSLNFNGLSSAITMIASKMLPTAEVQAVKFDPNLKSGEDVSYFVEYMVKFNPKFKLVSDIDCAYIRRVTENSVSRQPMSFNFNVEQRLDVIKSLDSIISNNISSLDDFIISKMKAQIGFIVRYLVEHPQDLSNVLDEIIQRKIYHFPYKFFWEKVGKNEVKQLVFSYCHPPFVDTSATIVGKRVQELGLLSDVIANDMSSLRKVDKDMMFLNRHLINDITFLQTETSFGGWRAIKEFSEQASQLVEGKTYSQIYSRVLWPGSNFAAAIYKLKHPETKWIAEFSDPAVLDIQGKDRNSLLDDKEWVEDILQHVPKNLQNILVSENNLYVWCELLAYLFADEIIFTCENQQQVMLNSFKYKEISNIAYQKSLIKPHPTLPKAFYQLGQCKYEVDKDFINIGYFGVFYANRNLNDFIEAINKVNSIENVQKKIKLHIFTNNPADFEGKYGEYTVFNSYLGYLDFLTTSNEFDYLLVNDAVVSNIFGINPYLPSKVSDYKGSNAKIIALVESGSALSKMKEVKTTFNIGEQLDLSGLLSAVEDHVLTNV